MRQTFLLTFLAPFYLAAQNLVINPSFEQIRPEAVVVPCEFTQFSYDFPRIAATWGGFRFEP